MANNLLWKDISALEIDHYKTLLCKEDCLRLFELTRWIGEKYKLDGEKGDIVRDFYYYTLEKNRFDSEQSSVLFSILKQLHERVISTPHIQFEADYEYFKRLLMMHSIQRPPYSIKIFSIKEMTAVSDYVINTYFRHYLMYKYAFTKKQRLEFVIENFMPVVEAAPEEVNEVVYSEPVEEPVQEQQVVEEVVEKVEQLPELPALPETKDIKPEIKDSKPEEPERSPKHEQAVQELKQFIQSVLKSKMEELKVTVNQKVQSMDAKDDKKAPPASKKK